MAPLLPRPHAAGRRAHAMVAAQIAPSRADLRILCGRFCAAVAVASQRRLQSRRAARHGAPPKASHSVGRSSAAARVVIAISAILQSSLAPPSSRRCGLSNDVAPAARVHAKRRRCNLVHRAAAAARPTSPRKEGRHRPLLERTTCLCNTRGRGRAYCVIPRTLLLKYYVGCMQRTGPGHITASGAVSIIQLLQPEPDPQIRWIMRGESGECKLWVLHPLGRRSAGESASGCNTTPDAPTAGEERGDDTTIKATRGRTEERMQQSTLWNGDICSGWPKFGFRICSLRSQLPLVNR